MTVPTFGELHVELSNKTIELHEHEQQMLRKHTITQADLHTHVNLAFEIADIHTNLMAYFYPQQAKTKLIDILQFWK